MAQKKWTNGRGNKKTPQVYNRRQVNNLYMHLRE